MQKSNIEWCDSTWNPVTGCKHGCEYCYARRIAVRFGGYDSSDGSITTRNPLPSAELQQPLTITRKNGKTTNSPFPFGFEPTFHRYRLPEPQRTRKPHTIFVCSMADLFGDWVPDHWIVDVFEACKEAPQHRYLFLTKNPARYMELAEAGKLPEDENFWYGSSVPTPQTAFWWSELHNTFVSIEPLLESFSSSTTAELEHVGWFIIGAETGNHRSRVTPKKEWIEEIVKQCEAFGKPIFMKDSLIPIVGEENMRREFPMK